MEKPGYGPVSPLVEDGEVFIGGYYFEGDERAPSLSFYGSYYTGLSNDVYIRDNQSPGILVRTGKIYIANAIIERNTFGIYSDGLYGVSAIGESKIEVERAIIRNNGNNSGTGGGIRVGHGGLSSSSTITPAAVLLNLGYFTNSWGIDFTNGINIDENTNYGIKISAGATVNMGTVSSKFTTIIQNTKAGPGVLMEQEGNTNAYSEFQMQSGEISNNVEGGGLHINLGVGSDSNFTNPPWHVYFCRWIGSTIAKPRIGGSIPAYDTSLGRNKGYLYDSGTGTRIAQPCAAVAIYWTPILDLANISKQLYRDVEITNDAPPFYGNVIELFKYDSITNYTICPSIDRPYNSSYPTVVAQW